MLEEFLKKLGAVIGKTYTPAEFKKILEEAAKVGSEIPKDKKDGK